MIFTITPFSINISNYVEDNEINNLATKTNKKGLTKEERITAKAERKAEKLRIKTERKAARLAAKQQRKVDRKAAKLAAKNNANETGFIPVEINSNFQDFTYSELKVQTSKFANVLQNLGICW